MRNNEFNIDSLIKASNNDEVFIRSMLTLFIDRTPGIINQMIEACKKKDYQQTVRLAHQLKPSVDMIGDPDMKKLILEIHEITNSESNCKRSPELISALKKQTDKVIELIKEKLNQKNLV